MSTRYSNFFRCDKNELGYVLALITQLITQLYALVIMSRDKEGGPLFGICHDLEPVGRRDSHVSWDEPNNNEREREIKQTGKLDVGYGPNQDIFRYELAAFYSALLGEKNLKKIQCEMARCRP